jgi:hypothetical protein
MSGESGSPVMEQGGDEQERAVSVRKCEHMFTIAPFYEKGAKTRNAMSDDFRIGVAGAVGFAVVAAIAARFRRKLSEFLNPTKKQKVGHSTDKTPTQIVKTSMLAGIEILVGLVLLGGIVYVLIGWRR